MTEYTDPPGMPADERMSPAEFRVVREFLGLTGDWLAARLGVSSRTVRHWEQGRYPIPDGVRLEVEALEERAGRYIGMLIGQLDDMADPTLVTYRDEHEYRLADPVSPYPASWHRAVAARVALEVRGLSIVYPPVGAPIARVSASAAYRPTRAIGPDGQPWNPDTPHP